MMAKRRTIGENPLDALIPDPTAATKINRQSLTPASTPSGAEKSEKSSAVEKERLTVHLPIHLIERIKNTVFWTPGLTLARLGEEAFKSHVDKLEKSRGGPFPPRKDELRGGRPMK
jgi:hypothetical protein